MSKLIDSRKFVRAWMTCETVADVAKQLKLKPSQISSKANTLRRKGVRLPKKLHGAYTQAVSVDELNKIVDMMTPGDASRYNQRAVAKRLAGVR